MQLSAILSIAVLAYTQSQVLAIALPEPINVVINIEGSNLPATHAYRTSSRLRNEPVHAQCYSAGSDCFEDKACCWNWCKYPWELKAGSKDSVQDTFFPGVCQGKFKPGSAEEAMWREGL